MANRSISKISVVGCLLLGAAACGPEVQEETGGGTAEGGAGAGGGGSGAALPGGGGAGGEGSTPAGALTVRTLDAASGEGVANVVVVVSNADGSLVDAVVSGADGSVDVLVPEGGFVTTLWSHDELTTFEEPALRTVREVRSFYPPGDLAVLEVHLAPNVTLPEAPMSVTFDVAPIDGVTQYTIVLSCGVTGFVAGTSGAATLDGYWGCPGKETFDAVLIATGDAGLVDYAVQKDLPFVAGSEATLDFSFTGAPLAEVEVAVNGAFGDELSIGLSARGDDAALSPRIDDGVLLEPAPAQTTKALKAAIGYGASYCHTIQWTDNPPSGHAVGELRRGCSQELPDALELDGGRLSTPTLEASATSVTFALGDSGEPGDGLALQATEGDDTSQWRWRAARAATTEGSFVFPDLPSDAASFSPPAGGIGVSLSNVDLLEETDAFVPMIARAPGGLSSVEGTIELAFTSVFLP